MRLIESIIEANHRAVGGDTTASVNLIEHASALPLAVLTCIDPRLNAFFPGVLGLRAENFIWLRNAGNIIYEPMSSMTRSIALAAAIKGAREIAIIGHTDCQVCKTDVNKLLERFKDIGVDRSKLPSNIVEFFGLFSSERQNVIKGTSLVRSSPLIGPNIPVHGILIDVNTGKLEWIVNGYGPSTAPQAQIPATQSPAQSDVPPPPPKLQELPTPNKPAILQNQEFLDKWKREFKEISVKPKSRK